MRRLTSVGVAFAATATIGLAVPGVAAAAGASTMSGAAPAIKAHAAAVKIGSRWTIYDYEYGPSSVNCEVFTFGSGTLFTGDKGDVGRWSSTATTTKLTVTGGGIFTPGSYKGAYISGDGTYSGTYKVKSSGAVYGPLVLAPGSDPYGFGSC